MSCNTIENGKCKFYGCATVLLDHQRADQGYLVRTHGNQCALVLAAHAPCRMEIAGEEPEFKRCDWKDSQHANRFVQFEVIDLKPPQGEEPE